MLAVGQREMYIEDTVESAPPQYALVARQQRTYAMRAGFWPRLLALFIDSLVLIAFAIFIVMINRATVAGSINSEAAISKMLWAFAAVGLGSLFYWLIEGVSGASPGKMLVGLKIAIDHGQKGTVDRYLLRYLCKNSGQLLVMLAFIIPSVILDFATAALGLILFFGSFWIFSTTKQTAWDHWTGTAVFFRRKLAQFQEEQGGSSYANANITALILILVALISIGVGYRTYNTVQLAKAVLSQAKKKTSRHLYHCGIATMPAPRKSCRPKTESYGVAGASGSKSRYP